MAYTPITPLPTAPARTDDPATFVTLADAFLSALAPWETDVNASGTYIDAVGLQTDIDATVAADAAAAATASETTANASANFKGNWADLSGSIAVPASVYHSNRYWILLSNLVDVTAKEPGVDVEWADASAGTSPGGATTTTSATGITLTADSDRVQVVTMTASEQSVVLPDATTLLAGGPLFVIENAGSERFVIRADDGSLVAILMANTIVAVYCTDIGDSTGGWITGDESPSGTALEFVLQGIIVTVNAVDTSYTSVAMLTSTKAICTYKGTSTYLQAVILDVSGSTITSGTVKTVNAVSTSHISVAMLTSTKAICFYRGTSYFLEAAILDVSGSTITAGLVKTVNDVGALWISVARLGTKAICTYSGTSNYLQTVTLEAV